MKTLFLPQSSFCTVWLFMGNPWALAGGYLLVINLVTFLIFGLDKWKAKRKQARPAIRRVPEKTLFVLSALGGSAGALLGMRIWHHKTLHKSFRFGIPAILAAQLLVMGGTYVYWNFVR